MEINYALIGKRIRETRKQRGLSAEELAEIEQQRKKGYHLCIKNYVWEENTWQIKRKSKHWRN